MIGGGKKDLVGLLEGRGTFQGTPTPPEPAPEIPLEERKGAEKKEILERVEKRTQAAESWRN